MTDRRDTSSAPERDGDILDEIQAEVAHDLDEDRPPSGGPMYQTVAALVTLVFGVASAVVAYGYGLGSLQEPGPGLWPFVVGVLIAVLSVALLVVGRDLDDAEAFSRSSLQPFIGAATFVVLAYLMPVLGFEIPTLALCIVWLRFLGGETWRSTIVIGVLTTLAFYLLFLYGLQIPLPHLF